MKFVVPAASSLVSGDHSFGAVAAAKHMSGLRLSFVKALRSIKRKERNSSPRSIPTTMSSTMTRRTGFSKAVNRFSILLRKRILAFCAVLLQPLLQRSRTKLETVAHGDFLQVWYASALLRSSLISGILANGPESKLMKSRRRSRKFAIVITYSRI